MCKKVLALPSRETMYMKGRSLLARNAGSAAQGLAGIHRHVIGCLFERNTGNEGSSALVHAAGKCISKKRGG